MKVPEFNIIEPWSPMFIIDVIHGDKFLESVQKEEMKIELHLV